MTIPFFDGNAFHINEVVFVWVLIAFLLLLSTLRGLHQAYRVIMFSWAWPTTDTKEEIRLAAQGQALRETVRLISAILFLAIGLPLLQSTTARWTPLVTMLVLVEAGELFLSLADQYVKYRIIQLARRAGHLP